MSDWAAEAQAIRAKAAGIADMVAARPYGASAAVARDQAEAAYYLAATAALLDPQDPIQPYPAAEPYSRQVGLFGPDAR